MKHRFWSIILLCVGVLAGLVGTRYVSSAFLDQAPKLSAPTVFDLGTVSPLQEIDFEIPVANSGKSLLEVFDIQTSCLCSAALQSRLEVGSGTEVKVPLVIQIPDNRKEIREKIVFRTNDPEKSFVEVELKADVEDHVQLEPNRVFFWVRKGGDALEKRVSVSAGELGEIEECHVSTDVPFVAARILASDSESVSVGVSLVGDVPRGELEAIVRVEVEIGGRTYFRNLPMGAMIESDLSYSPAFLPFSGNSNTRKQEIILSDEWLEPDPKFTFYGGELKEFLSAERVDDRSIAVSLKEGFKSNQYLTSSLVIESGEETKLSVPIFWKPNRTLR